MASHRSWHGGRVGIRRLAHGILGATMVLATVGATTASAATTGGVSGSPGHITYDDTSVIGYVGPNSSSFALHSNTHVVQRSSSASAVTQTIWQQMLVRRWTGSTWAADYSIYRSVAVPVGQAAVFNDEAILLPDAEAMYNYYTVSYRYWWVTPSGTIVAQEVLALNNTSSDYACVGLTFNCLTGPGWVEVHPIVAGF